ncbi:MAG: glycosyltransferase [Kiritimatiellae bacterium]|nr:glycosyltransferase [Kiritimatiellia bacterium]
MKAFFSIIVPCCNVAQYLRESLDSVRSQTFDDWECILGVEDSKDETLEIAREYEKLDSRFKVFTAPKSGSCSASRNTGIDKAIGEYIIFLDGDDNIEDGSLERLHDKIASQPGADLYPCAIQVFNEITGKNEELRDNYPQGFSGELSGPDAAIMIYSRNRAPCPMLQMTVFRHEFLVANNLKCLHGRKRQDSEFSPRALYLAKTVRPLHEPFYIYRIRQGSISTLAKTTNYFLEDYAEILKSLLAFHNKISSSPDFKKEISKLWARHWLTWICYYWFAPRVMKTASREHRYDTLRILFANGFSNFELLCRSTTLARRIARSFIKFGVRHPRLELVTDLFFSLLYNPLTRLRDSLR